jgi:chromatin remodeling complex protein RSC6
VSSVFLFEPKEKRMANALKQKVNISADLAAVIGPEPKPRTEVTKLLWDYIKKNKLQNPEKKSEIVADAKLLKVFGGKKRVTMFEMTGLVCKHLSS